MEKLGLGLDDDSDTGDQKQTNYQEARLSSIERCLKYLVHACHCRDAICGIPSCHKMKRVVQHAKSCKHMTNGGCPICKQLIALCCYHSRHCPEAVCPIPFCASIKNKLRKSKPESRLQEEVMLKRCTAAMENLRLFGENSSYGNAGPSLGALQAVQQVQATAARQRLISSDQQMQMGNNASWKNSRYAQSPQPHQNTQPLSNPQLCHQQPSQIMGWLNSMPNSIENSTMGPPQVVPNPGPSIAGKQRSAQAWQQLLHILKSPASAQQDQQALSILKANPNLMVAFIKQRAAFQEQKMQEQEQLHKQLLQQMLSNKDFIFRSQLGHQHPSEIMGWPNSMPNSIGNSTMGPPQVMLHPGPSIADMQRSAQAWQQLLQILKSPDSAQQEQQALAILKANSHLMAAFINQRAAVQQQRQRHQQLQQQMLFNEVNNKAPQCSQQNQYFIPTQQSAQNPQSEAVTLLENSSNAAIANQPAQSFLLADNLKSEVKTEDIALTNTPPTAPETLPIVKDWHQSVTEDLRHHLVQKIIQVILPNTNTKTYQDLVTFKDARMFNLVAYAEEVEGGIYNAADSWEEYYQLLAEKIPEIRKEFEKKLDEKAEVVNATTASWCPNTASMTGDNAAASTSPSHHTNPLSSNPSTTNQLPSPVSQEYGLSSSDNMDLTQEESTWQTC